MVWMGLHMWAVQCCAGCELYSVMLCVSYVVLWCVCCCVWMLWCVGVSMFLCVLHCGVQVLLCISSVVLFKLYSVVVYVIYESIRWCVCVYIHVNTRIMCAQRYYGCIIFAMCFPLCTALKHPALQSKYEWAFFFFCVVHMTHIAFIFMFSWASCCIYISCAPAYYYCLLCTRLN